MMMLFRSTDVTSRDFLPTFSSCFSETICPRRLLTGGGGGEGGGARPPYSGRSSGEPFSPQGPSDGGRPGLGTRRRKRARRPRSALEVRWRPKAAGNPGGGAWS